MLPVKPIPEIDHLKSFPIDLGYRYLHLSKQNIALPKRTSSGKYKNVFYNDYSTTFHKAENVLMTDNINYIL